MEWIRSESNFFAPVKALSILFRGIFAENIYKHEKDLKTPDSIERIDAAFLRSLIYRTSWNVYAKPALNNAEKVIEYLGRYTHRVAISNARIVDVVNDKVLFRWKDYRHGGRTKIMKVDAFEFINRFMMHVLPCGFYKIRYYGIFANKLCNVMLDTYLALNDKEMALSELEGKNWQEIVKETFGYDPFYCKNCKTGRMISQVNIDAKARAA